MVKESEKAIGKADRQMADRRCDKEAMQGWKMKGKGWIMVMRRMRSYIYLVKRCTLNFDVLYTCCEN